MIEVASRATLALGLQLGVIRRLDLLLHLVACTLAWGVVGIKSGLGGAWRGRHQRDIHRRRLRFLRLQISSTGVKTVIRQQQLPR